MVQGSGFRVQGLGFRVRGSGLSLGFAVGFVLEAYQSPDTVVVVSRNPNSETLNPTHHEP